MSVNIENETTRCKNNFFFFYKTLLDLLLLTVHLLCFCFREKKQKIQDIKNNIKEAIEVSQRVIFAAYTENIIVVIVGFLVY